MKDLAYEGIMESEEVQENWSLITFNWNSEEADELLKLLVLHYITVRGFSFTNSFMEKHKQSMKKSTEKSKALRKTLDT